MRHGFLLIDKPEGPTSHDIVSMIRKQLNEKKVGHLGTLDPAASGLLVLGVGAKALKVIELFNDLPKEYIADVLFGSVSVTYDREGPIEEFDRKPGVPDPSDHNVLEEIRNRFIGTSDQVPPAASAVKIGGERAYRKMRQGRDVDMPSRTVEITTCDIIKYSYPNLQLRVACSKGTYIRSLAHDLGQTLRVGAYLAALRRTRIGDWSIDDAVTIEDLAWAHVVPLKEILKDRPSRKLTDAEFEDLGHGRTIEGTCKENEIAWYEDLPVAVLEAKGSGQIKARKVL